MTRGRKKLPESIKMKRGTNKPSRMIAKQDNLNSYTSLPSVPGIFNDHGKNVYNYVGTFLINHRILNESNILMFTSFCREYGIYWEAEEKLSTLESRYDIIEDKNGNKKTTVNALHQISKESLKMAMKVAVEFGLTPASVNKIVFEKTIKKGIHDLIK